MALKCPFHPLKEAFKRTAMPRANRYFIPNQVWHITHRCHKREFLVLAWSDPRKQEGRKINSLKGV
jgi:hypothetical protein